MTNKYLGMDIGISIMTGGILFIIHNIAHYYFGQASALELAGVTPVGATIFVSATILTYIMINLVRKAK